MMAYDFATGEVEQLLDYEIPTGFFGTGGYAWNPEMTRGITGEGRGAYIAEELFWFTRDSWERVDLDFAQSYGPSWSPDGRTISFVAAQREGSPRRASTYDIYLMNPQAENIRKILAGVRTIGGTSFSPDGRLLAFTGRVAESQDSQGILVLDLETDRLFRVMDGDALSVPSWSPDGTRLVAAQDRRISQEREVSEILIIDLRDLIERVYD